MSETEHLAETRRWLRYACEDLEGAETLLERGVGVPRHIFLSRNLYAYKLRPGSRCPEYYLL
jgi:hypothetical protein